MDTCTCSMIELLSGMLLLISKEHNARLRYLKELDLTPDTLKESEILTLIDDTNERFDKMREICNCPKETRPDSPDLPTHLRWPNLKP